MYRIELHLSDIIETAITVVKIQLIMKQLNRSQIT